MNTTSAAIAAWSWLSFRNAVRQGPASDRLGAAVGRTTGSGDCRPVAIGGTDAVIGRYSRQRLRRSIPLLDPGEVWHPVVLRIELEVAHALRDEIHMLRREQEDGRRCVRHALVDLGPHGFGLLRIGHG